MTSGKVFATLDFTGPPMSCMATVSWHVARSAQELLIVSVDNGRGNIFYISATSAVSNTAGSPTNILKLNGQFGAALGLNHGEEVVVSQMNSPLPTIKSLHVKCESPDDWEILESNAVSLTSSILSQIRVVSKRLRFPLWVSKSLSLRVIVEKLEPDVDVGVLSASSEVIVPSVPSQLNSGASFSLSSTMTARLQPLVVPSGVKLSSAALMLLNNVDAGYMYRSAVRVEGTSPLDGADCAVGDSFYAHLDATVLTQSERVDEKPCVKIFFIEKLIESHKELKFLFPNFKPATLFLHPDFISEFGFKPKTRVKVAQIFSTSSFTVRTPRFSMITSMSGSNTSPYYWGFSQCFSAGHHFLIAALGLFSFEHTIFGPSSGWLLITGKEGSGKSTFAKQLATNLSSFPYYVSYEIVSCVTLKGKKPETVRKTLSSTMDKAIACSPAILILDDLDELCPPDQSDQQNPQEDFLHLRLSETVRDTLCGSSCPQVAIICTARSSGRLHHFWRNRHGVHIFQKEIHIPALTKAERIGVFETCLRRYHGETGAIRESYMEPHPFSPPYGASQADFSFQDNTSATFSSVSTEDEQLTDAMRLKLLELHDDFATPRILHRIAMKWAHKISSSPLPNHEWANTFGTFLKKETTELGEAEVTDTTGKITWDRIGGLDFIKKELTKILVWPIKYSSLYENSPVKLPSGILLYGYPGTGKTIVGMAAASLVPQAKFIHIKGPELLSKFIGASEQSVQDLFRKARNQSPCILFFDEFDSLVPRQKRGRVLTMHGAYTASAFVIQTALIEFVFLSGRNR